MPEVMRRISAVREFREISKSKQTRELSKTPTRFHVTVIPTETFLVIPEVSSENREYVPIGWLEPPTIPSNLVRVLLDADLWHFGILTSTMHMAWLRYIGGRLKSDYRYSIGLVYNTFPWPALNDAAKERLNSMAKQILDARANYPDATLADLYDRDAMKPDLRQAHRALDAAVDRLYRPAPFGSERERVEYLFGLYERLVVPLAVAAQSPRRRRRAADRVPTA